MRLDIRNLPVFNDLRAFLAWAKDRNELLCLPENIHLTHEMTAVQKAALRVKGPVLRLDAAIDADGNPSAMPVIGNLFGAPERVADV